MKILLPLIAALALVLPVSTQADGRHGGGFHGHSGFHHDGGFRHDRGFRHHGWRGDRGHFYGWSGSYIGEIIVLDDGCYLWNGYEWVIDVDCD